MAENELMCKPLYQDMYTNTLTEMLDKIMEQKENKKPRHKNYIMEFLKYPHGAIYAIRYPGATRGNISTDAEGIIMHIAIELKFYGEEADEAMKNYIGCKLVFEGE